MISAKGMTASRVIVDRCNHSKVSTFQPRRYAATSTEDIHGERPPPFSCTYACSPMELVLVRSVARKLRGINTRFGAGTPTVVVFYAVLPGVPMAATGARFVRPSPF